MESLTAFQELVGAATMASLWMLGVMRIRSMLWGLAAQGAALGTLVLVRGFASETASEVWLGVTVVVVKAVAIPAFLNWAAVRLRVVRDKGAGVAPGVAMLFGAALTAVCYFESEKFSATGSSSGNAGLAIAIVLIGLTVMMTRRLAMGMLIGFLVVDNGIFAYVATQTRGMPIVIELGVLFDLFVGVLLAGMVLSRVSKSFEHIDVSEMKELRE